MSVESTIVRRPRSAHRSAVAAAMLVFPTPPLPVYRRIRVIRCSSLAGTRSYAAFREAVPTRGRGRGVAITRRRVLTGASRRGCRGAPNEVTPRPHALGGRCDGGTDGRVTRAGRGQRAGGGRGVRA